MTTNTQLILGFGLAVGAVTVGVWAAKGTRGLNGARRRGGASGVRVSKNGKVVDIPVRAGAVVKLRENRSGNVTGQKAIVVGAMKPSAFSRGYGKQVYVCTVYRGDPSISEKGAGDVYPVGRAKRVPKMCKEALSEYKKTYGDR